jgi:hypothetical protein
MCAGACLNGSFRSRLLKFLEDPNRATAPEIGTDLELVATVATHAARRQTRHWVFRFLVLLAAGVVSAASPDLGVVILVLGGTILYFMKKYQDRYMFASSFQKQTFDPQAVRQRFPADLSVEVASSLPRSGQNVVVYSGWTPFVGAGADLGGWSFTVATSKAKETLGDSKDPEPFTTGEIYEAIEQSVKGLRFAGLETEDYYFVNGCQIRDSQQLLPQRFARPIPYLSPDAAYQYELACDTKIRGYKWIRVRDWGDELVMSFLLRCALRGDNLFVEIRRFLLTPIADKYRSVDKYLPPRFTDIVTLLFESAVIGPVACVVSPVIMYVKLLEGVAKLFDSKGRARRKLISRNPQYDYGTPTSARQMFSTDRFLHYFQKVDGDFYIKVLEHAILDEIVTFLDERNIDTSEIKDRQTTILNSGIIVQGGDVKAASLAVGSGAQSQNVQGGGARRSRVLAKKTGASA